MKEKLPTAKELKEMIEAQKKIIHAEINYLINLAESKIYAELSEDSEQ